MFLLNLCFSTFYPGFSSNKWSSSNVRYSYSSGDHWVADSVFFNLINNDNGGSIMIKQDGECRILISNSMFYQCRTSLAGGGIYIFCNSGGNSVLSKLCSNGCQASHENNNAFPYCGQFCFLYANIKNNVFDCTTSESRAINPTDRTVILLWGGNQKFDGVNSSCNQVWYDSLAIVSSEITRSSFCTFANEHPTRSIIVHFYSGNDSQMFRSNIVNNTITVDIFGHCIQYSSGKSEMLECVIDKNKNGNTFDQRGGQMTIKDCWIQTGFTNSGAQIINAKSAVPSFSIVHFASYYCKNDILGQTTRIQMNKIQKFVFLNALVLL